MQTHYQAIRGTYDIFPEEAALWQKIEQAAREVFGLFRFREIRTPVFEATELFSRSIGQTTDIVTKEMYTFLDKKGRSITLRPEETACVVRALIERSETFQNLPQKLYYIGPMFRYEKPQSGRNRQFHQIGVEAIGSHEAGMDAEVITLLCFLLERLGLEDVQTEINTVGCPECRPAYAKKLKDYLADHVKEHCEDCRGRYDKNPLRVFDCKNAACIERLKDAPVLLDSVCDRCADHFQKLQEILKVSRTPFQINKRLVRGIDYYTRTTFELRHGALGAQDAIAAGGRYDTLVEELGGPPTPAVGFAIGQERLAIAMKSKGIAPPEVPVDAYVVSLGQVAYLANVALCLDLRRQGFAVEMDHEGKSLKAQMRQADRLGCRYALIRGENELKSEKVVVKNLSGGGEEAKPENQIGQILLQDRPQSRARL